MANDGAIQRRERLSTPLPGFHWQMVDTDDGSRTLQCLSTGQTFHSGSGALAESLLVFLENSLVRGRLQRGLPVRVLEIGFGSGLNFWLTASAAMRGRAHLEYVAIDTCLVPRRVMVQLGFAGIPACQPAFDRILPEMPETPPSAPGRLQVQSEDVHLDVWTGDACHIDWSRWPPFDAIYHDPFSPETSPELWNASMLGSLAASLRPGGRLVTYCVKSEIRKRLLQTGLNVFKTRGPVGGKREVLVAEKPN